MHIINRHMLRFNDASCVPLLQQTDDDGRDFVAIARPVKAGARAFSVVSEFFQISIEMNESFVFDRASFIAQSLPILDRTDCRFAPLTKSGDEIAQRAVQLLVAQSLQ